MLKPGLLLLSFTGLHLAVLLPDISAANLPATLAGMVALSSMALTLCLAARWCWLDTLTGGPDRSYQFHRWLGYGAVIGTVVHWPLAENDLGSTSVLNEIAGETGEFAAVSLLTLAAVSACRLVPYQWWKKSHLLMGPLYLIIVFHSVFSGIPADTSSTSWWAIFSIGMLGIAGWLATLLRHKKQHVRGEVTAVRKTTDSLDFTVQLPVEFNWQPGQFVNLSADKPGLTEYHPFSFASAAGDGKARFIIKASGDYTRLLHRSLAAGDTVMLKEVAGRFRPQIQAERNPQVWAAAGAGITPFLASLDAMSADKGATIDLLYCGHASKDAHILQELETHAERLPQLNLHIFSADNRLTAAYLSKLKNDYRQADLYLCGPEKLKQLLIPQWQEKSMKGKIHHEAFDFRNGINLPSLQHTSKHAVVIINYITKVSQHIKRQIDAYSRT